MLISSEKAAKWTIPVGKMDFALGKLESKVKDFTKLTDDEVVNVAKSNVRSAVLKDLGIETRKRFNNLHRRCV